MLRDEAAGQQKCPAWFHTMVEYPPHLKHLANQFVESSAERYFVRQGTAMSEFSDSYFDAKPTVRPIRQVDHAIRDDGLRRADGLRYSSPWPWMLALAISLSMWASLAWLI
jgi:hypothetical protein